MAVPGWWVNAILAHIVKYFWYTMCERKNLKDKTFRVKKFEEKIDKIMILTMYSNWT